MQRSPTIAAASAEVPARRIRTWPALLALLFLSPAVGELISGSTPPLLFDQRLKRRLAPPAREGTVSAAAGSTGQSVAIMPGAIS